MAANYNQTVSAMADIGGGVIEMYRFFEKQNAEDDSKKEQKIFLRQESRQLHVLPVSYSELFCKVISSSSLSAGSAPAG